VVGAEVNGKPSISVVISDNLVKDKNLNAGNIVRELAKEINGGGGGQAFYAQAGGSKNEGLDNAINKAKTLI
jgi:alanyl-tRNA synthetase